MLRGRDRRVLVIPAIGITGFFGCGGCLLVIDGLRIRHGSVPEINDYYVKSTEAVLLFHLVIAWVATFMIIWKLYHVGHRAMGLTGSRNNKYLRIILALVESGMLFSVVMGVYVALWFAGMVRIALGHLVPTVAYVGFLAIGSKTRFAVVGKNNRNCAPLDHISEPLLRVHVTTGTDQTCYI